MSNGPHAPHEQNRQRSRAHTRGHIFSTADSGTAYHGPYSAHGAWHTLGRQQMWADDPILVAPCRRVAAVLIDYHTIWYRAKYTKPETTETESNKQSAIISLFTLFLLLVSYVFHFVCFLNLFALPEPLYTHRSVWLCLHMKCNAQ